MQILLTSGLLLAMSAILLHQFLSRSFSVDDNPSLTADAEAEAEAPEEQLKAA